MTVSRLELSAVGSFDTLAPAYDAWYDTPLGRLVDRLEGEAVLGLVGGGLSTRWRRLKRPVVPSVWRHAAFLRPAELGARLEPCGFTEPRWRRAVHFVPLSRWRVGWLERWEAVAARWMPGWATFVVSAARRA